MMHRLYKKNEVSLALVWIMIYCLVSIPIRGQLGDKSPFMFLNLALIATGITVLAKKYHLEKKYGLDTYPQKARDYLYFIPVWILTAGNLWEGFELSYTSLDQLWAVLSIPSIGYAEEIILRGFLFRGILAKDGATKAIMIVSAAFGIGHIVNLFAGQANLETILQIISAIVRGFLFTGIVYKGKSLIPCILAHGMMNAFFKFARESVLSKWGYIFAAILVAATHRPYLLKLKEGERDEKII